MVSPHVHEWARDGTGMLHGTVLYFKRCSICNVGINVSKEEYAKLPKPEPKPSA